MGCASSTPMITSGSEMLKAASHVAEDAAKSAENAVQDVTQSLGKTLDTAKETVGTAVTGIAHDLGSAFKDKTDEAKNNLLETLHLNGERETAAATKRNATGQLQKQHRLDDGGGGVGDDGDDDITQRLSRAPTPTPLDTDSLKTSTPEPEIEQALANQTGEDSPPTPKPNISELERLSAELHEIKTETDVIADAHVSMSASASTSTLANSNAPPNAEKTTSESTIQRRPSTTEWEKYADLLAKNQKFHPNEIALRRRLLGAHGSMTKIMTNGLLTAAATTTTTTMTTLGNTTMTANTNSAGATTATTTSAITGTTATLFNEAENALTIPDVATTRTKNGTSKVVAPQYFRDFTRPKTDTQRGSQFDDESGQSDRNYEGSTSSPTTQTTRPNARVLRYKKPRAFTTTTVKKMHRQLTSLIGMTPDKATMVSSAGLRPQYVHNLNRSNMLGRNFDFNPSRMRISSPATRKRNSTLLPPLKYGNSAVLRTNGRLNSPIKINAMRQRSRTAFMSNTPIQLISSSSSTSRIGLHSLGHLNSPITKTANRSLSRSSRSSTNNSITLKSNCTTPLSRSASKTSLHNFAAIAALDDVNEVINEQAHHHNNKYTANSILSRASSPLNDLAEDFRFGGCLGNGCSNARCKTPINSIHSPMLIKNTSSFLSSPRTSPFTPRKSYAEIDENDYNSKAVFIADLSSVTENRNLLTPSPYKIRERCAVCYNKYVVK